MGNVNRVIFWFLIPLVLTFYFAFRLIEWREPNDRGRSEIAMQHIVNLNKVNNINCLILGGSNSFFSISAHQISSSGDLRCYNLSLLNEGYADEAYFDFIKNAPFNKNDITHIFYSSAYLLTKKAFADRLENNKNGFNLFGDPSFKLISSMSIAVYLERWLLNKLPPYPNPTSSGDFNFREYGGCDTASIRDTWFLQEINSTSINWVNGQISSIKSIFPNAQIYFVLPSTLGENYSEAEFSKFTKFLRQEIIKQSVFFIEQTPFSDRSVLCDGAHHANRIGREIRTRELITIFKNME